MSKIISRTHLAANSASELREVRRVGQGVAGVSRCLSWRLAIWWLLSLPLLFLLLLSSSMLLLPCDPTELVRGSLLVTARAELNNMLLLDALFMNDLLYISKVSGRTADMTCVLCAASQSRWTRLRKSFPVILYIKGLPALPFVTNSRGVKKNRKKKYLPRRKLGSIVPHIHNGCSHTGCAGMDTAQEHNMHT